MVESTKFSELIDDIIYVIFRKDLTVAYSICDKIEMETSGRVQQSVEENGFIKINRTTWVNPHFVETVTHKPRHIVLVNSVSLKVSRRCWHCCKNISEKGDATLKMQPDNFNTI